jgi:hypothetical protein
MPKTMKERAMVKFMPMLSDADHRSVMTMR